MTWKLDSAVEIHKESPYTFYLPSDQVISQLKVGDLVKLIFMATETFDNGCQAERMWVEILERDETDFRGKLANQPYYLSSLQHGDLIDFKSEHICSTQLEDPYSKDMDYYFDKKITVSNDVLSRNEFNFMLRFDPDNEHDLGWVFFSGYEDDEFSANSENFQVISVGKMLNMDDSILEFIDVSETLHCAYERNKDTGNLTKIENYDWSIHE
ncbi:DUF2185 domain-containing protein [Paenibacillus alba]|uniref:immunity protein Imm33 domain-containing protein n=1 Tax=Paenibacillus alba TaxID=1197127 RepID=UPI00156530D5|nr:DUF2185 domain-containing protein [Paenibacillus alba]NQX64751.1 DUF2185 domain-containing protein [Paenibacillus alba]